jgi:hypothetical protein
MFQKARPESEPDARYQRSTPRVSLIIVYRPIDQLKLDPLNPRRHSKKQVRQIANSIHHFGFNVPILTDRYGNVIAMAGCSLPSCSA